MRRVRMDANIILTAIVKCKNAVLGGYAVESLNSTYCIILILYTKTKAKTDVCVLCSEG